MLSVMALALRTSSYVNSKPQKEKPANVDEKSSCTDIGCLVAILLLCVCAAEETC